MTPPESYRRFYEYEADIYRINPEDEPAFLHRRNLVRRLLPEGVRSPILDAGCGDGAMCDDLVGRTGATVVGVDLSLKRALRGCEGTARAVFAQGNLYRLPFRDDTFPLVLCADLLEHLDDPASAVRELVRVSSRHVLVTVPYRIQVEKTLCPHCLREYFLYGHQHSFGKEGVTAMARDAGATVDRFEHLIPMFECRRYRYFPFLKWLVWGHFKNTGTLGALLLKRKDGPPAA
jgi:ubiquinone/menaquinone biosynthesis C-methylase UbiE